MDPRLLRRRFLTGLLDEVRVIWPILSALLVLMIGCGIVVGLIEGWPVRDSLYFSFVTGLTIGYGDLVPKRFLARLLAMLIGTMGILTTALVAAVAVAALTSVRDRSK